MKKEADAIDAAVAHVLNDKSIGGLEIRTGYVERCDIRKQADLNHSDLGGKAKTTDVGAAVCSALADILSGKGSNGAAR